MSDKDLQRAAEWARARLGRQPEISGHVQALGRGPRGFWGEAGKRLDWIKPYTKVKNTSYAPENVSINWYEDGTLNVSANCIDRHLRQARRPGRHHLGGRRSRPTTRRSPTAQLHERVCQFANVLKANGVKKGDRVTIYLPMIPEAAYAMLACARIGAVHSVVFGGFSPDSLAGRIDDCRLQVRHHGRRRRARRPDDPAQEEHRRGAGRSARAARRCWWCRRTGGRRAVDQGPRFLAARRAGQGQRRLPARGDERRGPALHPLHLGLDRQAEGRAAHHRRLSGLHVA